jgi:hypothetical protein
VSAGPYARFENSGWLGITARGSGTTHLITGTFVQTDAGTLQLRLGANGSHDALQVVGTAARHDESHGVENAFINLLRP